MSHSIVIGADIGGSHITAAQIDVTNKRLIDTSLVRMYVDSLASAQEVINVWAGCIKQAMQNEQVAKVCLAMPGPFNYEEGLAAGLLTAQTAIRARMLRPIQEQKHHGNSD